MTISEFSEVYAAVISLAMGDHSEKDIHNLLSIVKKIEDNFGAKSHLLIKPYQILCTHYVTSGQRQIANEYNEKLINIIEGSWLGGIERIVSLYEDRILYLNHLNEIEKAVADHTVLVEKMKNVEFRLEHVHSLLKRNK